MTKLTIALGCLAITVFLCPALGQAAIIEVNVNFDLNNSVLTTGNDPAVGWQNPIVYFPEVHPIGGDTLRLRMDFVDKNSNRRQRLRMGELGIGQAFEYITGLIQGPDTSDNFITANDFTFQDVTGELLLSPVGQGVLGGGSGVGSGSVAANMTNTAFSFTGITWEIRFQSLVYEMGDGFNLAVLNVGADRIDVVQATPEPSTIALLSVAIVGLAFTRRVAAPLSVAATTRCA